MDQLPVTILGSASISVKDLGDDRLSKRGNASFQAYLDKTMISYHLLIRHLH